MTDTYTPSLRLQLPTIGADGNGVWPTVLNTDWGLVDTAVTGVSDVDINGLTSYTLTANDGSPDQSRSLLQSYTGTLSGDCTVSLPASVKIGWAQNATSGGKNVILTTGGGTTLELAGAGWNFFYCDGTNVSAPVIAFGSGVLATGADAGGAYFRATNANFGFFVLNDDSSGYLLSTVSGDPFGGASTFRPFAVNFTTGAVTIDGTGVGAVFGADATAGKQPMLFDQTFGAGAAVVDKSTSRALGTSYTNSTGKPIFVSVQATSTSGAQLGLTINGSVTILGAGQASVGFGMTVVGVVPVGATYEAFVNAGSGTLTAWTEFTT